MTRSILGTASKLFFSIEYADEVADAGSRPAHVCIKGVFDPVMVSAQPWMVSLAQREADFFAKIAPTIKHMGYPKGWWGGKSDSQGIAISEQLLDTILTPFRTRIPHPWPVTQRASQVSGYKTGYGRIVTYYSPCL